MDTSNQIEPNIQYNSITAQTNYNMSFEELRCQYNVNMLSTNPFTKANTIMFPQQNSLLKSFPQQPPVNIFQQKPNPNPFSQQPPVNIFQQKPNPNPFSQQLTVNIFQQKSSINPFSQQPPVNIFQQQPPVNIFQQKPTVNPFPQQPPVNIFQQQPPVNIFQQKPNPIMFPQQPPVNIFQQKPNPIPFPQQPPVNIFQQKPNPIMFPQQPLFKSNIIPFSQQNTLLKPNTITNYFPQLNKPLSKPLLKPEINEEQPNEELIDIYIPPEDYYYTPKYRPIIRVQPPRIKKKPVRYTPYTSKNYVWRTLKYDDKCLPKITCHPTSDSFKIVHSDFGSIEFLQPININDIDFDMIIFEQGKINIDKIIDKINIPVRISLFNINIPIEKLQKFCIKQNTTFVSYIDNIWTFDIIIS
jgi:hypothetical protein